MKKIVVFCAVLFVSSNTWALNPPSYVGRNVHEVLKELDGVKVHYIRPVDGNEVYKIFIDDMKIISFYIAVDKITSVAFYRIYYSSSTLGKTINTYMQDDIISRLVDNHSDALGEPVINNSISTKWSGEAVGRYFMNPEIKSYLISRSSLLGEGIMENWNSKP
jgi:hypothetical protein